VSHGEDPVGELFHGPLLEIESFKEALLFGPELIDLLLIPLPAVLLYLAALSQLVLLADALVDGLNLLDERIEPLDIVLPALDLFILNDPVEAFLPGSNPPREVNGLPCCIIAGTDHLADHLFRLLDLLGYLDFLFAGEQGDLSHLLQVHPYGVVENLQLRRHAGLGIPLYPLLPSLLELLFIDDLYVHPLQ